MGEYIGKSNEIRGNGSESEYHFSYIDSKDTHQELEISPDNAFICTFGPGYEAMRHLWVGGIEGNGLWVFDMDPVIDSLAEQGYTINHNDQPEEIDIAMYERYLNAKEARNTIPGDKERVVYGDSDEEQADAWSALPEDRSGDIDRYVTETINGQQTDLHSRVRGSWQVVTRDGKTHTLVRDTVKEFYKPAPVDVEKMLVRQAAPTVINPRKITGPSRNRTEQLTIVGGDAQIPFEDPQAVEHFQTAVAELQPNNIVIVGDMLDLENFSKFEQRQEWAGSTQGAIDRYHQFLAQLRADAPNARIYTVHGNHEERFPKMIQRNAAELLGLRRACSDELAVLTLKYLVRYDDLEVESIEGYPNGTLWLADNLKFVHGTGTKSGGKNASWYLGREFATTVYGHSHRQEVAYRTVDQRIGSKTIAAASPGALCLTDGTVPGVNHAIDSQGKPVKKASDWQQGLLQIEHQGEHHDITPVRFTDRGMLLNGKRYENQVSPEKVAV